MTTESDTPYQYEGSKEVAPFGGGAPMPPQGYYPQPFGYYPPPPPPKPPMPPFMVSAISMAFIAVLFVGAEKYAPLDFKPSHVIGSYEASIDEAVADATKGIETQYQAQIEQYQAQTRTYIEQSNNTQKAKIDAILQYYSAAYQRNQVVTQAYLQANNSFTERMMNVAERLHAADVGVGSGAIALGHFIDAFEPGSGSKFTQYGVDAGDMAAETLRKFAEESRVQPIAEIDETLMSPEEVLASVNDIETPELPALPKRHAQKYYGGDHE